MVLKRVDVESSLSEILCYHLNVHDQILSIILG